MSKDLDNRVQLLTQTIKLFNDLAREARNIDEFSLEADYQNLAYKLSEALATLQTTQTIKPKVLKP